MSLPLRSPSFADAEFVEPVERRQWIRHACGPEISCQLLTDQPEAFWAVRVQNISPRGIKLILDRTLATGDLVAAAIHNQTRAFACQRRLRITFTFEDLHGGIVLGANFLPELTEEELQTLRAGPVTP